MYPVFSLVLDKDVKAEIAMTYPELYKELTKVILKFIFTHVTVVSLLFIGYQYSWFL